MKAVLPSALLAFAVLPSLALAREGFRQRATYKLLLRLHRLRRPVGVGTATAKSIVLNIVLVHIIGRMGTLVFWGANPRAPIGG